MSPPRLLSRLRRGDRGSRAGHHYSPIPSLDEVKRDEARIFGTLPRELPGICLHEAEQLALMRQFMSYYAELPFPEQQTPGRRYFFQNTMYSYSDAIFLYCMIRHVRPRRIIEVGSGYSSCVTLDTNEQFFGNAIDCTFIEPFPEALEALIEPDDRSRITLIPKRLQDVELEQFRRLQENDILFIDSTHVAKVGSDVNYIFREILPALSPGVYVHFHDIFYPFEYPKHWIYGGRWWNEAYLLRAFLTFNTTYAIVLFNTFLAHFHREEFARHMPLCLKNEGGSIWLRRIA